MSLRFPLLALALAALPLLAAEQPQPVQPAWIERSNDAAQPLLRLQARFSPESAGRWGVSGLDEDVTRFTPDRLVRFKAEAEAVLKQLDRHLSAERDPLVAQDLRILIKACRGFMRSDELWQKYNMPYSNPVQIVFSGVRALLDDQVPEVRRKAALVRLRKYAGMEPGYAPLILQLQARWKDWSKPGQLGPARVQVETNLARTDFFVNGIGDLFVKYHIEGYEEPLARFKEQLKDYSEWVKREVLPKARTDFRIAGEQYEFFLTQNGVDISPRELSAAAHKAFTAYQAELQETALIVAQARGLAGSDYRSVIRELKKEQLAGDAILAHYQERLSEIEAIIRRERLITLPNRPMRIRLATPAEAARLSAPNMQPPPFVNNTGQQGEFVLPLNIPAQAGSADTRPIDDFTFAAASWTLTAHEARPGHELQFAAMIERGVSLARSLFAWNSVNIEGWGLYAEHLMKPYEPLEGQLITLQFHLLRAARAFIDPELQSGRLTTEQARRILTQDVMLSDAFANQEIERYTFRQPGQAPSYFYGFTRLVDLRREVEKRLGTRFDQQRYHDFIIAQGLLPPDLLRQAVMSEFVRTEAVHSR